MNSNHNLHSCNCGCCAAAGLHTTNSGLNRRDFLFRVGAAAATGLAFSALDAFAEDPALALPARGPLPPTPAQGATRADL